MKSKVNVVVINDLGWRWKDKLAAGRNGDKLDALQQFRSGAPGSTGCSGRVEMATIT